MAFQVIRVLLVDDHELIRGALRKLIEAHTGLQVVGESDLNGKLVALARQEQPDIIVLDVDDNNGVECIPDLLKAVSQAQVIVLTEGRSSEIQQRAVYLGAQGIVLKQHPPNTLLSAIEKVYEGEVWLNRAMMARVLNRMRHVNQERSPEEKMITSLTEREREVITLIGQGLRNQEISEHLHISESTVGHHLSSVYSKLGVPDRLGLVVFAFRHHLIEFSQD